eukprot:TRINITY_DN5104_c0_g1_i5.p1 TRINITY_DN5104_c0_g1~~TRINITY_DN5104_c0_g1_i5.p1  ORF type:complete len:1305 (+),score=612.96 TRINITY_DN5104_c0_g1_i5:333-3917(+)
MNKVLKHLAFLKKNHQDLANRVPNTSTASPSGTPKLTSRPSRPMLRQAVSVAAISPATTPKASPVTTPKDSKKIESSPSVSSLSDDIDVKKELKYNRELERMAMKWVQDMTGMDSANLTLHEYLKSGEALCLIINKAQPGTISKIHKSKVAYQQIENIGNYRNACQKLGLNQSDIFEVPDLFDEKNLGFVVNNIHVLALHLQKQSWFNGPSMEREDRAKSRNLFSESLMTSFDPDLKDISEQSPVQLELVKWFNYYLEQASAPLVDNLTSDLRTGVALIHLLQQVTGVTAGNFEEKPQNLWQCLQNAQLIIRFLVAQLCQPVKECSPQDIVTGNPEALVNLVTFIRDKFDLTFLFFKIADEGSVEQDEESDEEEDLVDEEILKEEEERKKAQAQLELEAQLERKRKEEQAKLKREEERKRIQLEQNRLAEAEKKFQLERERKQREEEEQLKKQQEEKARIESQLLELKLKLEEEERQEKLKKEIERKKFEEAEAQRKKLEDERILKLKVEAEKKKAIAEKLAKEEQEKIQLENLRIQLEKEEQARKQWAEKKRQQLEDERKKIEEQERAREEKAREEAIKRRKIQEEEAQLEMLRIQLESEEAKAIERELKQIQQEQERQAIQEQKQIEEEERRKRIEERKSPNLPKRPNRPPPAVPKTETAVRQGSLRSGGKKTSDPALRLQFISKVIERESSENLLQVREQERQAIQEQKQIEEEERRKRIEERKSPNLPKRPNRPPPAVPKTETAVRQGSLRSGGKKTSDPALRLQFISKVIERESSENLLQVREQEIEKISEIPEKPALPSQPKPKPQKTLRMVNLHRKKGQLEKAQIQVRSKIVNEILTTETNYANNMVMIKTEILDKMAGNVEKKDADAIFANLAEIAEFHRNFVKDLQERISQWDDESTLADVFQKKFTFIEAYRQYIHNYNTSLLVLPHLRKKNFNLNKIIRDFEEKQMASTKLNLEAFLIMPIQRVPRYILLLQDLHKYSSDTSPDKRTIPAVLENIRSSMKDINSSIDAGAADDIRKIAEIERSIDGDFESLIQNKRRFLREGSLIQVEPTAANPAATKPYKKSSYFKKNLDKIPYWFLFNDCLICCEPKKSSDVKNDKPFLFSKKYDVSDFVAVVQHKESGKPVENSLNVICKSDLLILFAKDTVERCHWMDDLILSLMELEKNKILESKGKAATISAGTRRH